MASNFNTLLYPLFLVDLGLDQTWLYSPKVNFTIVSLFLITLVFIEKLILKKRNKLAIAKLSLMLIGSMSFGTNRLAVLILGYSNFYIVELGRFLGVFLLLFGAFVLEGIVIRLSSQGARG